MTLFARLFAALGLLCLGLVAVSGQSSLDEWTDNGAIDLAVKVGPITPIGRLGLVPASTTSSGGLSSLLAVDLQLLTPAKFLSTDDVDIDQYVIQSYLSAVL
jgi:hypothetical protein